MSHAPANPPARPTTHRPMAASLIGVATLLLVAGTPTAIAAESNPTTPTGTRIDGPHGPCASLNRRVITREDLQRTGRMTLADAIARAPGSTAAADRQCRERDADTADEPAEADRTG